MYYRYFSLSFLATLLLIAGNCRAIQAQAAASQNNVSGSATAGITSKDSAATSQTDAAKLTRQGATLAELGLYEAAAGFFERSTKVLPGSAKAWLNLSIVYDHLDRPADSLAAARKAVELDGTDRSARQQVCDMAVFAKQYSEATSCYSELAKGERLDDRMLANLAMAAIGIGDLAKAAEVLGPLAERQPYNSELQNALGVISFKQKRVPQAVAYFKHAIEMDPDRGLFRYNMAVAQMQANNRAAVLSQYHLLETVEPTLAAKLRGYIFADKILVVGGK